MWWIHIKLMCVSLFFYLQPIYSFLAPYLKLAFGAWLAYKYFLKKLIDQRREENETRRKNQKDLLYKDAFDQISEKIEGVFPLLGAVKSYAKVFQGYKKDNKQTLNFYSGNFQRYLDKLEEKIGSACLTIERYDFLRVKHPQLKTDARVFFSELIKISDRIITNICSFLSNEEIDDNKFKEDLELLSEECYKINVDFGHVWISLKNEYKKLFESLKD